MLIHDADPRCARSLSRSAGRPDTQSQWINRMRERRHPNIVAVAPANNEPFCAIGSSIMARARIVWSLLSTDHEYRQLLTV